MSPQLISRNPDLQRLRDEGYEVEIIGGHLVVRNVPYVNSKREVCRGSLVSTLTLAGNATDKPDTHVAMFAGEYPCNADGSAIDKIRHASVRKDLGHGLVVNHSFSSKPKTGYADYYEKMTTYVRILENPARSIEPGATSRTYAPMAEDDRDSPFVYVDTASGRAGISAISRKLGMNSIAIVGLGGTGSYVLDLVAKTPVKKIILIDGDKFLQHNAFRSPGAASLGGLKRGQSKVAYFKQQYSRMHRNIVTKRIYLSDKNPGLLADCDFVFLCLDKAPVKKDIVEYLETHGKSFIDVGIGVVVGESGMLLGQVRTTTSTPSMRNHVHDKHRIPFDTDGANEYAQNIQVADLNMLNAALAVIKWKRLVGFYQDLETEHHSVYSTSGNHLLNEDQNETP